MDMDTVKLNSGMDMSIIGYGVYLVDPSVTERCVTDALSVGYRSLDIAQYYENEAMVGSAYSVLRSRPGLPGPHCIPESRVPGHSRQGPP